MTVWRGMINEVVLVSLPRTMEGRISYTMIFWWHVATMFTLIHRNEIYYHNDDGDVSLVTIILLTIVTQYWQEHPSWGLLSGSVINWVTIWVVIYCWFSSMRKSLMFYCCKRMKIFNMILFAYGALNDARSCWRSDLELLRRRKSMLWWRKQKMSRNNVMLEQMNLMRLLNNWLRITNMVRLRTCNRLRNCNLSLKILVWWRLFIYLSDNWWSVILKDVNRWSDSKSGIMITSCFRICHWRGKQKKHLQNGYDFHNNNRKRLRKHNIGDQRDSIRDCKNHKIVPYTMLFFCTKKEVDERLYLYLFIF